MAYHKYSKRIKGLISNSYISLVRIRCDQEDLAKMFCHYNYLKIYKKFYNKKKVQKHCYKIDENTVNSNLYLEHL